MFVTLIVQLLKILKNVPQGIKNAKNHFWQIAKNVLGPKIISYSIKKIGKTFFLSNFWSLEMITVLVS